MTREQRVDQRPGPGIALVRILKFEPQAGLVVGIPPHNVGKHQNTRNFRCDQPRGHRSSNPTGKRRQTRAADPKVQTSRVFPLGFVVQLNDYTRRRRPASKIPPPAAWAFPALAPERLSAAQTIQKRDGAILKQKRVGSVLGNIGFVVTVRRVILAHHFDYTGISLPRSANPRCALP